MKYTVLIPCAGRGSRFNQNQAKQYTKIGDKTILEYTLQAFLSINDNSEFELDICIIVNPDDTHINTYLNFFSKIRVLRVGGNTRAQTVLNGLNELNLAENSWVLVHDAARCCITTLQIIEMMRQLHNDPVGGILAIPAVDTIKQVKDNIIEKTLPRETIYLAQTPQMFRYKILKDALTNVDLDLVTDEASSVEQSGYPVKIVLGSTSNIKITYPEDINLAELFLNNDKLININQIV